jgi:membrane associated rhomboid family serine protease
MVMSGPGGEGKQPIFNVPTAVVALLGVLIAIHVGRSLLPVDWDNWVVGATAFIPIRYSDPEAIGLPGQPYASYTSWITHMLIHGSALHLMFNAAWLLAFGGAVANRIGSTRFLAFAAVCGIFGALAYLVVRWGIFAPMVGASGAVMGLMGASMRFLYPALDNGQGSLRNIHRNLRSVPLMTLRQSLTDQRVLLTTAMLVVLNLAGAYGMGPGTSEGTIAWEAHAGGYLAGFLLFGFFDTAAHNDTALQRNALEDEPEDIASKPTLH